MVRSELFKIRSWILLLTLCAASTLGSQSADAADSPSPSLGTTSSSTSQYCDLSPGDAAAGIGVYADPTCVGAAPGVGCFEKTGCRNCQFRLTDNSKHLIACPSFANTLSIDGPVTPAPVPSTPNPAPSTPNPAPSTPNPAPSTPNPAPSTPNPAPSTPNPAPSTPNLAPPTPIPTPATGLCVTSPGDLAVGVSVYADATCLTAGGTGCIGTSACRNCKTRITDNSKHLPDCPPDFTPLTVAPGPAPTPAPVTPAPATACAQAVSSGDQAVGISAYSDAACMTIGGLGCFPHDACRFCKTRVTGNSKNFLDCPTTSGSTLDIVVTSAPPTGKCGVTSGDLAVGVSVYEDASCKSFGGLGCIADQACRLCKFQVTDKSKHLLDCPTGGSTLSITPAPSATTPAPSAPIPAPALAPSTPAPVPAPICTATPGNLAVGISTYVDLTCLTVGSTGCVGTSGCRNCKFQVTDKSQHLPDCPGTILKITPAPWTPTPATPAPVPSTPSPAPPSALCTASSGDLAVGISSYADATCLTPTGGAGGGLGCVGTSGCRNCKFQVTDKSQHLLDCSSGKPLDIVVPTPATPAPVPSTPSPAPPSALCTASS
ncbi:hypothetical protein Gpo141_00012089, partial [Globisporangium polare]